VSIKQIVERWRENKGGTAVFEAVCAVVDKARMDKKKVTLGDICTNEKVVEAARAVKNVFKKEKLDATQV